MPHANFSSGCTGEMAATFGVGSNLPSGLIDRGILRKAPLFGGCGDALKKRILNRDSLHALLFLLA
jgi:hypothetical protein